MSAGLPFPRRLLWASLALSVGCSSSGGPRSDVLAARILPSIESASTAPARSERPRSVVQARADEPATNADDSDSPKPETLPSLAAVESDGRMASQPLPLQDAIATAFRLQPRLRVFLETIEQARG